MFGEFGEEELGNGPERWGMGRLGGRLDEERLAGEEEEGSLVGRFERDRARMSGGLSLDDWVGEGGELGWEEVSGGEEGEGEGEGI